MNRFRIELSKPPRIWWAVALGSYFLLAVDLVGHLTRPNVQPTGVWIFLASKLVALLAAGLWIWVWRVRRIGLLLIAWAICVILGDLMNVYPDSRLVATVGLLLFWAGAGAFLFHAGFAYPTGRLERHWPTRLWVFGWMYVAGLIVEIPWLLFQNQSDCADCRPHATSYLYVGHTVSWLSTWDHFWLDWSWLATAPIFLWLIWRRFRAAGHGARRTVWPFLTAFLLAFLTTVIWSVNGAFVTGSTLGVYTDYLDVLAGWLMVLGAVFGVLVTRRARGVVGDLVVDLGRARPGGVRDALAGAIGDPTLKLGLWVPQKDGWVDEQGREVELPASHDRAVTLVGDQLAAIVHDPVLLDQPALLEAAGSAARFALENERLQAELRAQLEELRESRARIVRAGDEERRRLERDLHDGAQQRLLALGMALQLMRPHVTDEEGDALLEQTEAELQEALAELRELARGIHPAVLTDQGLDEAIRTLARRAPVPVDVLACGERLPGHVETAAYFVVAEGLANLTKYAHATRASVEVEHKDGLVQIVVDDDGVGGAVPYEGSGLAGLADRLGAIDGTLTVASPIGGGTHIRAEIPCAP
jgi:signal transduction histidine kinase